MFKAEQEILKEIVEKLKTVEGDEVELGHLLEKINQKLPEGEIKNFFLEVEQILAPINEIAEQEDEERIDEALETLRKAKAKFKKGSFPEGIPLEIIRAFRKYLSALIFVLKMIKSLTGLFE